MRRVDAAARSAAIDQPPTTNHQASLVIQTSFIGDLVLTTPLIASLAERGPVDVVATPLSAELLANNPSVRRVVAYDKRGEHRGTRGILKMALDLRGTGPYASAYLAQGSLRSATLAMMIGAAERVGFDRSAGRRFYTRRVRYVDAAHHAARLASLAEDRDLGSAPWALQQLQCPKPALYPGAREHELVDALLRDASATGERLVALAPGSVWATKRWPYYVDLAALIAPRARIVVIGSAADSTLSSAIVERVPNAIDATGRLSLLASAELIGRCSAIVSNDSAPVHLASAMNTPTIVVFGPTVSTFGFGPLAERSATVGHESLACRPCDRHGPRRCPLGHWRCMRDLSAEIVFATLAPLLDQ